MKEEEQKQGYKMYKTIIQQNVIANKEYKTRLWQENIPKTNVEQTKNDVKLYLYLYPLGI